MNNQEIGKLKKKTIEILKKHLTQKDTVIAGISGGPDSIFLLHFLAQLPIKIIVAHLNHSIRSESDKEEQFVKNIAEKENLIFESEKKDIQSLSKKQKKGLEETGRIARYNFFKKLKKKYKAKFIITAHHADDNLETILFNFARGCGLQGLSGMKEVEYTQELPLLRPLLSTSKKQILDFLKTSKIKFKTDKSNYDTKFKRNFIRHKIIPELKKLNPSLTETTAKNCEELKKLNEYLISVAQNWIKKNSTSPTTLNAKSFREQSESIQKIILLELHKKIIGNNINISNTHLKEVIKIIKENIGNKRKKLGELTIEIKNNAIRLKKNEKKSNMK